MGGHWTFHGRQAHLMRYQGPEQRSREGADSNGRVRPTRSGRTSRVGPNPTSHNTPSPAIVVRRPRNRGRGRAVAWGAAAGVRYWSHGWSHGLQSLAVLCQCPHRLPGGRPSHQPVKGCSHRGCYRPGTAESAIGTGRCSTERRHRTTVLRPSDAHRTAPMFSASWRRSGRPGSARR